MQGTSFSRRSRPGAARGRRPAHGRGIHRAERVPHLADLRRSQLARPLDAAVRAVDRQAAGLQQAAQEQPLHAERRLPQRRLEHRERHPLRYPPVVIRNLVLPLRHPARHEQRRLRRADVRLRADPRPVHLEVLLRPRTRRAAPAGHGRDRLRLVAHPVGAVAATRAVVADRRRHGLRPAARPGAVHQRGVGRPETRAGRIRAVDPVLARRDVLVPAELRRPEPGGHRAGRPPAGDRRQWGGRQPRGADQHHLEGSRGVRRDLGVALAERGACRPPQRRSGR